MLSAFSSQPLAVSSEFLTAPNLTVTALGRGSPALPFHHSDHPICRDLSQLVHRATRPVHFHIRSHRRTQAKVNAQIALGDVAAATPHFIRLAMRLARNSVVQ